MASVPAVIACADVIKELEKHDRNLLGIEMEAYGMFYAAYNSIKPRPIYVASFQRIMERDGFLLWHSLLGARILISRMPSHLP